MTTMRLGLASHLGSRSHALSSPPVDEDGIQEDTLGHKTCFLISDSVKSLPHPEPLV